MRDPWWMGWPVGLICGILFASVLLLIIYGLLTVLERAGLIGLR